MEDYYLLFKRKLMIEDLLLEANLKMHMTKIKQGLQKWISMIRLCAQDQKL